MRELFVNKKDKNSGKTSLHNLKTSANKKLGLEILKL